MSKNKYSQFSTPTNIAKFMVAITIRNQDLRLKTIFEPFVGAGACLIPLIGKGAILVGNDIDPKALELCKDNVPEAILTNCDIFKCKNSEKKLGLYCSKHIYHEPKETLHKIYLKQLVDKGLAKLIEGQEWKN